MISLYLEIFSLVQKEPSDLFLIEKHFKLDDTDCGPDSTFSLTPPQMSKLVQECSEAWTALGQDIF